MTEFDNTIAWFEIPVRDLAAGKKFYSTVLKTIFHEVSEGPNPMAIFNFTEETVQIKGHLYPGTPASDGTGPTLYFNIPDTVEAAMERVREAGGGVLSEVIEIEQGRFAYCQDPDGNSMALFTR
ncbi:MAG: VOC family protein [Sneathiella sp.]